MRTYLEIARTPGLRTIMLMGLLLRIPIAGASVLLTLHVVTTVGGTYGQAGLIAAVYTIAGAVAGPWRGRLLDRIGLRRTLLPSLLVVPVIWSIAPWVSYWPLLVLAGVGGLFVIPVFSVVRQVIVATTPANLRGPALSLDSTMTELSFMIGPAVAVLIATVWPTPWAIILFYVGGALACISLYVMNPPLVAGGGVDAPEAPGRWLQADGVAAIALMFGGVLVLGACDVAIVAALRIMGHPEAISWVLVLWAAGSAVGGIAYGALQRPIQPGWLLLFLAVLTGCIMFVHGPVGMAALLCVSNITCAPLISSTVDQLSRSVPSRRLGEAMGWHATAGTAATALGAPVAGAVVDSYGWPASFAVAGAVGVMFAIGGLVFTWVRRSRA